MVTKRKGSVKVRTVTKERSDEVSDFNKTLFGFWDRLFARIEKRKHCSLRDAQMFRTSLSWIIGKPVSDEVLRELDIILKEKERRMALKSH